MTLTVTAKCWGWAENSGPAYASVPSGSLPPTAALLQAAIGVGEKISRLAVAPQCRSAIGARETLAEPNAASVTRWLTAHHETVPDQGLVLP